MKNYEEFCRNRAQDQLPYVSYRNFLRQWRRSARAHGEDYPSHKGSAKGTAGEDLKGKGKGGVTPPPPPTRKRQTGEGEGGETPPAVKAKNGEAPSGPSSSATSVKDREYEAALSLLQDASYTPFPGLFQDCAGSIKDLNEHRVSAPVSQQPKTGLTQAAKPTVELANALLRSSFHTRTGMNDEDLFDLFSYPTAEPKGWFRFSFRSPNHLEARGVEQAFHGTHLECLHSLAASGRLLPSSGAMEGTRHFEKKASNLPPSSCQQTFGGGLRSTNPLRSQTYVHQVNA